MEHEPTMNDNEPTEHYFKLGDIATGTIEAKPEQEARLDEVTERLADGEFHRALSGTSLAKCIDGRHDENQPIEAANSAGGSYSHVVMRALTGDAKTMFVELEKATFDDLHDRGVALGVHTDTHAHGEKSGCGADDRLPEVFAKIAENGSEIRALAEEILGRPIDNTTHEKLIANAAARTDFGTGAGNFEAAKEAGAEVETLEGDHNEVVAVINLRRDTTLDREALAVEFPDHQAFNVDAWAFAKAAELTAESDEQALENIVALTYYNLATSAVLTGSNMRVVLLSDGVK